MIPLRKLVFASISLFVIVQGCGESKPPGVAPEEAALKKEGAAQRALGEEAAAPEPEPNETGDETKEITAGVFVVHGPLELPNKSNKGFMNNPGFVVTDSGVVVVDPGSSSAVGEMIVERVKEKTDQKIVAIFNTHIHGDHWLGNGAIKKVFPEATIYAHPAMKEEAEAGAGDRWVANFQRLTEGTLPPTTPVAPDRAVNHGEVVAIGGVQFRVHHTGHAHTKADIMIEVVERKVIFLGDNAGHHRILRMDDGHFKGNIEALDHALATGVQHFVPGHGPTGGPEAGKAYRDYLATLREGVAKLYEEGIPDYEMKPKIEPGMEPWKGWSGFEEQFGKHVSLCYHEVEVDSF